MFSFPSPAEVEDTRRRFNITAMIDLYDGRGAVYVQQQLCLSFKEWDLLSKQDKEGLIIMAAKELGFETVSDLEGAK